MTTPTTDSKLRFLNNLISKLTKPFCLVILFSCICTSVYSQSEEQAVQENTETQSTDESDQDIEVISVTGQSNNPAMRAFQAGDFELAAVEFRKNARCALRQQRSKEAFVEGLQNSSRNQISQGGSIDAAGTTNSAVSGTGGNASNLTGTGGNASNQDDILNSTCSNRGQQLYMAGLSQIQLGQVDEAEKNFRKATVENKRLYDAHYRLALIFLLQGKIKDSEKRYKQLQRLQKLCKDCDAKQEILARVEHIKQALEGKVDLQ